MNAFQNKKLIFIFLSLIIGIGTIFLIFYNKKSSLPSPEKEKEKIEQVTQQTLDKEIEKEFGKDYKISSLTFYENNTWAVAILKPISFQAEGATIIYKKEGEGWKIFLGPGTSFEDSTPDLLNQLPPQVKKAIGLEQ